MVYPKFKLLITPPEVDSRKSFVETIEFTKELIDENRIEQESDDETIRYILEEIISEYEQTFHKVSVFDESQWKDMPNLK